MKKKLKEFGKEILKLVSGAFCISLIYYIPSTYKLFVEAQTSSVADVYKTILFFLIIFPIFGTVFILDVFSKLIKE